MALIMLASVVLLEAALTLLLASNIPLLCNIAKRALGLLIKSTKGTAILLTIVAAILIKLAVNVSHIRKIQKTQPKLDHLSPSDQKYILSSQIQEVCLTGFSLFLAAIVLRLHSILREMEALQQQLQISRKQAETAQEEWLRAMEEQISSKQKITRENEAAMVEVRSLTEVIIDLRLQMKRLQLDSDHKDIQIKDAEATVEALKKQAEGFLLECDRVVAENENLRKQLSGVNPKHYARLHSR